MLINLAYYGCSQGGDDEVHREGDGLSKVAVDQLRRECIVSCVGLACSPITVL